MPRGCHGGGGLGGLRDVGCDVARQAIIPLEYRGDGDRMKEVATADEEAASEKARAAAVARLSMGAGRCCSTWRPTPSARVTRATTRRC